MSKSILVSVLLSALSLSSTLFAADISAIDSQSCKKMNGATKSFILALKPGESIPKAILQCVNDADLPGASITGIGSITNPTLTYYHLPTKMYLDKTMKGTFTVVSMSGNVSESNKKRATHIHVSLSDHEYHMLGGHLIDGNVSGHAEITITPMPGKLVKKMDKETGLESLTTNG